MRRYGADSPFGEWVRSQSELDSISASIVVNDIDWMIHKYRITEDRIGTRSVQLSMVVELKTHGSEPNPSQQEILFFNHQLLAQKKKLKTPKGNLISVWHFGCFVLSLEGIIPRNGDRMRWGSFRKDGTIKWTYTNKEKSLIDLLGFKRRPDNPTKLIEIRRHHKTRKVIVTEDAGLGFLIEKEVTFRS